MRLFVAVELDETVQTAAKQVVRELERHLDPRVRLRWVPAENIHITVRFIGHVDDMRAASVLEALRPPLPISSFDIALGSCGVFPTGGPPRAIWIGLAEGLPLLTQMHRTFNERLSAVGFKGEDRPFSAHLTLARVKDVPRDMSRATREAVRTIRVPAAGCTVRAATVFQSLLSPKGSTYQRLLEIPCVDPAV